MSGIPEDRTQQSSTGVPQVAHQQPDQVLAIISLVTGMFSVLTNCCCIYVVPVPALVAIVTGILGLKKVKEGTGGGKGMAMAGLICGVIAIVLAIVFLVLGFVFTFFSEDIGEFLEEKL